MVEVVTRFRCVYCTSEFSGQTEAVNHAKQCQCSHCRYIARSEYSSCCLEGRWSDPGQVSAIPYPCDKFSRQPWRTSANQPAS